MLGKLFATNDVISLILALSGHVGDARAWLCQERAREFKAHPPPPSHLDAPVVGAPRPLESTPYREI